MSKGAIKGDDPNMAFGSQYVEAAARQAWSVLTAPVTGGIECRLKNTKSNNGARSPDIGVGFAFDGDEIYITGANPARIAASGGTLHQRITDHLAETGLASMVDIARALDVNKGSVHRVLHDGDGFTQVMGSWQLAADLPDPI